MENFIGSELYTKKGIGAFALNQESKIKLKYFFFFFFFFFFNKIKIIPKFI